MTPRLNLIYLLSCVLFSHFFLKEKASAQSFSRDSTDVYVAAGAYLTTGTIGDRRGIIVNRNINTVAGYVQLGVTSGFLTPFLYAEYASSEQSTESAAVGGTNMSGRSYLFGPGIRFDLGKVFLTAIFTPFGSYSLSRQTAAGESTNYLEPSGGVLQLGYTFKSFMLFAMMRYIEYSRVIIGNVSTDINSNKVVHSSQGGGIQWGILWKF